MQSIGIGEIQKNTSILTNLSEALEIVDKRKRKRVAVVYPAMTSTMITKLAGKYKKRILKTDDLSVAKEEAMKEALREKYGLSD
jgi:hypothetical protein